ILGILFLETTTIGVKYDTISRVKLVREEISVETEFGIVRVKVAKAGSDILNVHPEYEDIVNISRETGIPLKEVFRKVLIAYWNREGKS
ncbi:MAG: LarC family nickel insertion protein, partial [Deltaproteobacteria bacterium]|nr:LarC family nickel insertion protein [Deltaproteobacteria bacterium]